MKKIILLLVCCLGMFSCSDKSDYEDLLEEYLKSHSEVYFGYINIFVIDNNGKDMTMNCHFTNKDPEIKNHFHDRPDIITDADLSIKYYINEEKKALPPFNAGMNRLMIGYVDKPQIIVETSNGIQTSMSGKKYLRVPDPGPYIDILKLNNTISYPFTIEIVCKNLFGDSETHKITYTREPWINPYGLMGLEGIIHDMTFDGKPVSYCDGSYSVIVLK